ncbi:MAG: class I SAM-dependent methyltransferase [Candidatus Nanopelagicales bacterium]
MIRPADQRAADPWTSYLARFHAEHPGITEELLSGSRHPEFGDPYRWLRDAVPIRPARVLDIACGSAPMQPLFADSDYLGIDLSPAELGVAAQRGRGHVLTADALALPVPSGSLDVVVCSMAIMLLRPIGAAMAEVARVLRPGGTFAAIRPVSGPLLAGDLRVVAPLLLALRHLPELPQRVTGRGLGQVITGAGMRVLSTGAARFAHPLATSADARLAVEALYLPHVSHARRELAAARLARLAGPGRVVPVSLHRMVAVRPG